MFNFKLPGRRNAGGFSPDPEAERARREASANATDERLQRPLSEVVASLETHVGPVPATAAEPRASAQTEGVEPAAAGAPTAEPLPAAPPPAHVGHADFPDLSALDEAQRRAAEQRQAAEAMLREAQQLEQRIAAEAAAAIGEAEQRAAQEGQRAAARARALEQHASEQAATLQERMDRMLSERKEHEVRADAVRVTERQAQTEVDARQALLEEALKVAAAAAIAVTEVDRVVVGYMKREELLRKEIEQLTTRAGEQREIRESAEAYAREAEQRLAELGVTEAPRTSIEEIRAIEARLTQQLEAVQRTSQTLADIPEGKPATAAASEGSAPPSATETASTSAMPHVA